jgi:hypothetical protein
MYKTEHLATRRLFGEHTILLHVPNGNFRHGIVAADALRVWEAVGSIGPTETIGQVASRLCRFDGDAEPAVAPANEEVLPADVATGESPWQRE